MLARRSSRPLIRDTDYSAQLLGYPFVSSFGLGWFFGKCKSQPARRVVRTLFAGEHDLHVNVAGAELALIIDVVPAEAADRSPLLANLLRRDDRQAGEVATKRAADGGGKAQGT